MLDEWQPVGLAQLEGAAFTTNERTPTGHGVSPRWRGPCRAAESLGLAVTKIPRRSRSFHEFGPYMLTNPRNGYAIVVSGLDLEDVEKWLLAHRHQSQQWRQDERDVVGEWTCAPPSER